MANKQTAVVRILLEAEDTILLVRRNDDVVRPNTWEIPGGKVDEGELLQTAALREMTEETGVDLDTLEYRAAEVIEEGESDVVVVLYVVKLQKKPKITLSKEHQEWRWISARELPTFVIQSIIKKWLDEWFELIPALSTESSTNKVIIYSDGGSRGNPGPSATGFVIYDDHEQELSRGGTYLGITTNNQAEYLAVKEGLVRAKELGVKQVRYFLDSMLVVKQMSGEYKIKNKDLWPIYQAIKDLSAEFKTVTFKHVRREKNKVADSIVNEVLDAHKN